MSARYTVRGLPISGAFTHWQVVDNGLKVLSISGHTLGATSYLRDSGKHHFLFTGVFL